MEVIALGSQAVVWMNESYEAFLWIQSTKSLEGLLNQVNVTSYICRPIHLAIEASALFYPLISYSIFSISAATNSGSVH